MRKLNVMLDLETVGTKSDAGILSIGAVTFAHGDFMLQQEFYEKISLTSIQTAQFSQDAEVMKWWDKQDQEIRNEAFSGITPIGIALCSFYDWCMRLNTEILLWGNGSDFDNVILCNAYQSLGLSVPWKFYNNRCFRTLKNLFPGIKIGVQSNKHNALEDAKYQAAWAEEIMRWQNIGAV